MRKSIAIGLLCTAGILFAQDNSGVGSNDTDSDKLSTKLRIIQVSNPVFPQGTNENQTMLRPSLNKVENSDNHIEIKSSFSKTKSRPAHNDRHAACAASILSFASNAERSQL